MITEVVGYFKYSQDSKSLLIALAILAALMSILVLATLYYRWRDRKVEFKHFQYLLKNRDINEEAMKKLFSYLKRHDIEPHLLLESEHIMQKAVEACGLDLKEMREKLGFNTSSLVKRYIQHQQELRKKWNKH